MIQPVILSDLAECACPHRARVCHRAAAQSPGPPTSFSRPQRRKLKSHPRQFLVLANIDKRGGSSQTTLVERTGIDRSTMADIVRRLLRKGYVQRRRMRKDARTYSVTITARGLATLEQVTPIANEVMVASSCGCTAATAVTSATLVSAQTYMGLKRWRSTTGQCLAAALTGGHAIVLLGATIRRRKDRCPSPISVGPA